MALSGIKPFIHVSDSNGNPYVGAVLKVYLPGTTTLASIYSDDGLSVSMSNPLSGVNASNAAGNFPRFYIAAGTYKLRAETSAGVLIWEYDNIDTGLSAGSGALPITAGGTGGITAAAARTNLDVPSNSELADLAAEITDIQTSLQNVVSVPQGYLTPTSGTPVISTGVTSGTSVYYTPFIGNTIPIYDGTQYNATQFSELTLTLNSNHLASTIYDAYVISDSGTLRLVTGPAWNNSAAGAGSRGTGAGTAEITRTNGLWTNANSMTARNGATTYSVSANRATYVGSIFIDSSAGQVTCHRTWGQSRKFGIWNAYNRVPIVLRCGDSTASWSRNTTSGIQVANSAGSNFLTLFVGLAEEFAVMTYVQNVNISNAGGSTPNIRNGIGYNSTSAISGTNGQGGQFAAASINTLTNLHAVYSVMPAIGIHNISALENVAAIGGGTTTFQGTEDFMILRGEWRG